MTAHETHDTVTFSLRFVSESPVTVNIELAGSITTESAAPFQKKIEGLINDGFYILVFDLSDVTYVSAAGIGAFIRFSENVRQLSGYIILQNLQPPVNEIFTLPGFENYFFMERTN